MKPTVTVRELTSPTDLSLGRNVFDLTWPMDSGTEITSNLLQAMVHSGAYLSGAFIDSKCVGAAFAFPATNGGLHLHSHMAAVLEEYRDYGIGHALKIDQWHWAKKNNYKEIAWTFDPLVSRNAKLNLVKLGVDISSYHPNFYSDMPDTLNAGDESDRLIASWSVIGENPVSRDLITAPQERDLLIQIPKDIVEIRAVDKAENLKWRRNVREQFLKAFEQGGKVIGFSSNNEYVVRI